MSTDRIAKGVIDIEARADGVDATINKVESAFEDLGRAGQQAGADASAGIAKIGDGANKVVESTARAKKSVHDLSEAGSRAGTEASTGLGKIADAAEKVDVSVDHAKRGLEDLGEAGRQAGAGNTLPKLGGDAKGAERKIDAATRSMTYSIQRQIAMLETGGKATSDYYALLAQQRGIDLGRLRPYLEQLDEVNTRHRQAGQAADQAADEMAAATRSIANSIQRQIAMLEAGGKATSDYYTLLAQQRGVDPGRLKPYLDQLDAVNSRHRQAGQTSGEMAAAMRSLPAQFTDIATSIAGGQDPMLVFLQQGGQLKDMFGGVGPAAKAMGQYVLGLVNPFTLSAVAVGALLLAHEAGAREMRAYNEALASTNGAAGVTADAMADMASKMDAVSGTQAKAAETLAALASTGAVAGRNLQDFSLKVSDYSKASGAAIADLADNFAALAEDPTSAVVRLDKELRFLTAGLYEQISALEEQGNKTAAAELAQQSYADQLAKRTAEMAGNLGAIERGWNAITGATKEAIDAMLNVGRQQTIGQQIADIDAQIASLGESPSRAKVYREQIAELRTQREALMSDQRRLATDESRRAEREQVRKDGVAAAIAIEKALDSAASKSEKMQKALAKAGRDFAAAANAGNPVSAGDQAKILANIRKQYAEKPNTRAARQAEQAADAYGDMERSLRKQLMTEQELTVAEKVRMDLTDKRYKRLSEGQKSTLIGLAKEVDAFKVQQKLFADMAASAKELAAADTRRQQEATDAAYQAYQRVADQVKTLQQEADTYGLSAAGVQDYLLAKAEERLALEKSGEARQGVIEQIEREIAERRKLTDLQRGKDVREAGEEAAKRAAEEWQKSADQINQALTDALMRGFEDGKGFAENFADSLKSTFATMVLRPAVQAVVQPMAGAVNAALYGGQGGQGGAGGMFSAGGFGVGSAAGLGSLVGSFGNLTGSATTSAYGTGMGLGAADAEAAANAFRTSGMNDVADSLLAGQKMASTVGKVANVAGYAMAAYNGIKAIEQGRWGAAAGTAIGAFTPLGPLGAAIGGQLGGLLDGAFGGGGGQKFGGEGAIGRGNAGLFPEGQTDAQVQSALDAFGTGLKEVAQKFGAQLGDVQFAFGYETDPQGDAGNFFSSKLAVDGVTVRDINVVKFDGDAEAKMAAEFKLATVLALKQANLAPELQQAFEGFDPATAVAADVDKVMARLEQLAGVQKAFEGLSLAMPQLSKLTLAAKEHILSLAGGVDALTGAAQTYYQGFYSEAERLALTSKQVAEALGKVGVAMPATRDEYRKQVEALDLSSDAGRKAYAAMLGLAGAFGTVADAGKSAADEMAQVAQQRLADAESVLRTAYDRESSALKSTADRLRAFTRSLRDFRQSLTLGELSTLSPEAKYGAARDEFDKVLAAAAAGDEEAQDKLTQVAQAYLEASRAYNASSAQYVADYNRVQSALLMLEATGKASETVARQQLTLMQKQVGALLKLDDSVISVRDAVARLYMLRAESGTVEPITPIDTTQPGTVGGSLVTNLNALYQQVLGRDVDMSGLHYYSGQLGAGKTLDWVYRDILASDEAKRRILDGSHAGGLASVPFDGYVAELHAGERVLTAQQSREYAAIDWSRFGRGSSDALVAEVKALRAEVAALRADNAADAAAGRRQTEAVARATLAQGGQLAGALDRAAADRI